MGQGGVRPPLRVGRAGGGRRRWLGLVGLLSLLACAPPSTGVDAQEALTSPAPSVGDPSVGDPSVGDPSVGDVVEGAPPVVLESSARDRPGVAVPGSRGAIRLSFAPVVRAASPAVVNIYARKAVERREPLQPFFSDPFFRFFFEDFGRRRAPSRELQNSLGSGVIVAGDGLIVTNYHVIEDADEIMVVLADRREFQARVIGADEPADLALLDIEEDGLPTLPFGDSDELEVGDLVLAIGNPFGIGKTVTSGIVSALARSSPGSGKDLSFIQTDAAINPGNSGGALVTVDGRLVGINSAIFTRGGGSIGIGFAIPVNLVKALIRAVEGGGDHLARPWLGAATQPVDADLAASLGLQRPVGVLVVRVHPSGPAAATGLAKGDVLMAVEGREIVNAKALSFRLAVTPIGETVELTVWRRGRIQSMRLALETPPYQPEPDVTQLEGDHALAGVTVANLSPALNRDLDRDLFDDGVVVVQVDRDSPVRRVGLRRGDRLLQIDGEEVRSVGQLGELLEQVRGRWQLEVERGGRRLRVMIG